MAWSGRVDDVDVDRLERYEFAVSDTQPRARHVVRLVRPVRLYCGKPHATTPTDDTELPVCGICIRVMRVKGLV